MTSDSDRPYVDAQTFSDADAYVYEAVATLEYAGRQVTGAEIAAATDLDDQTVSEILRELTERGVLVREETSDEPTFELARRDWSATPDTPSR